MSCDTDFEVLMAYLDGDLGPVERGRVAEHVVGCATCRETVEDLRAVSGALTKWSVPEPAKLPTARELLDRSGVPAQAAVSRAPASRWSEAVRRWGAAAALLLVAATIATVVLTRTSQERPRIADTHTSSSAPPPPQSPAAPAPEGDAGRLGGGYLEPGLTNATPPSEANNEPRAAAKATNEKSEQEAGGTTDGVAVAGGEAPPAPPVTTAAPEAAKPKPADDAPTKDVERSETAVAQPPPAAEPAAAGGADEAKRDANRDEFGRAATEVPASRAKEIRTARLTLETGRLEATVGNIESAARASGGRLVSRGAVNETKGGRQTVIQIEVDAEEFDAAVNRIKGLGTLKSEFRTSREANAQLAEEDRDAQDKKQKTAKSGIADTRRRDQLAAKSNTATIVVTIVEPK